MLIMCFDFGRLVGLGSKYQIEVISCLEHPIGMITVCTHLPSASWAAEFVTELKMQRPFDNKIE